jgi:rhomboid-related protein 1/2/3
VEAWRYVTYALVHLDSGHIMTNLFLQLLVGVLMEMRHGWLRVAGTFLLGVLGSSLAYYCFNNGVLLGTSGGVYCLVGSIICSTIFNWHEDQAFFVNRIRSGKAPIACGGKLIRLLKIVSVLMFAVADFGYALYRRFTGEDIGVSVVAHAFGSLTGLLTGFSVLRNEREEGWERKLGRSCLAAFLLLAAAGLLVSFTGYRGAVDYLDY